MKRPIILVLVLGSAALAQEPRVDPDIPPYKPLRRVSGSLRSVGSDTLNNVLTRWGEAFAKAHPDVKIIVEGKGSSTAPPALINGEAQLGPMSRPMRPAEVDAFETKYGYRPTALRAGYDALAIFVNKDNPLERITLRDADRIFSKTRRRGGADAKTWGDVGLKGEWANQPIHPYGRNSASGMYGFFREKVLGSGDFKDNVREQPGSAAVVQGITQDKLGIGYSGIGYSTSGSKRLEVSEDGAAYWDGDPGDVAAGKYPLAKPLLIYLNQPPNKGEPQVQEFVNFILSREGQEIVAKDGYIPLPAKYVRRAREDFGLPTGGEATSPESPKPTPSITSRPTTTTIPPMPSPTPTADPTPSAAVSPEPTTNTQRDAETERAYNELNEGVLVYNSKLAMRQGVTEDVIARVGRDVGQAGLKEGFPTEPEAETLKVSGVMEAYLTCDTGAFRIEGVAPTAERSLLGGPAEWMWRVTPLISGPQKLRLTVVVKIELSDRKTRQKVIVKEADIDVEVDRWYEFSTFFKDNWQWLLTGAAPVAILGGLIAWLRRRKERAQNAAEEEAARRLEEQRTVGFGKGPPKRGV